MFAVVIYRNDDGLRGNHEIATNHFEADPQTLFECMDYLKVEWCPKKELRKPDLQTLRDAGFRPRGRGAFWPRFESSTPGWYPWGLTEAEGRLMTELLSKVARFVYLRGSTGPLHEESFESIIPIIPSGEEETLKAEDIEWLPFIPAPAPAPDPVRFSDREAEALKRLPKRKELLWEMTTPLLPRLSNIDVAAGRPAIPRCGFIIDCHNDKILSAQLVHGAAPLRECAGAALTEAFKQAQARPAVIRVDNPQLESALRFASNELDIRIEIGPLTLAYSALQEFESYLETRPVR